MSELRDGRKPGTRVFSVKDQTCGVPTLVIQHEEAAEQAAQEFENVFKDKNLPRDIPTVKTWGTEPRWIGKVLADSKVCPSTSDAKRMIKQGAVSVDGEKVTDENLTLNGGQEYLIKVGKKRFLKITA